ncbi:MAG: NAD-dependent epimerase/dehydratase family protein [Actinomycetota bacterium]
MRILVIGGTQFVGRAFVEHAAGRGHEVSLFHRGATEPEGLPAVEHLHGDRDGGLHVLEKQTWDAALDTCAYTPRAVTHVASVLRDRIGHYALVSSLSVHPEDAPPGATEDSPTYGPPFPETEEVTEETYGPLKVASEQEALRAFSGRYLIVRPGYIVGPHDPTDRFTFYVRRAASGGEMLAPGPPDAPLQVVDVRDVAAFMLERIELLDNDVYGVVGPGEPITMSVVLESARASSQADTEPTWVSPDFLHTLGDDVYRWLPMWHPEHPGAHAYDASKAIAAGLRHRTLVETVTDTLTWDAGRGRPELRAGLSPAKEAELLQAWRARS